MSEPAAWLQTLADSVARAIAFANPGASFGCHFCRAEGIWEVTLFAEAVEVVGGAKDGSIKKASFGVHITEVLDLFQNVSSCTWQAQSMGDDDDLGPHLAVEGIYKGRNVWLRILAEPPQHFPVRRVSQTPRLVGDEGW
jgi:hypothetical protein